GEIRLGAIAELPGHSGFDIGREGPHRGADERGRNDGKGNEQDDDGGPQRMAQGVAPRDAKRGAPGAQPRRPHRWVPGRAAGDSRELGSSATVASTTRPSRRKIVRSAQAANRGSWVTRRPAAPASTRVRKRRMMSSP